MAPADNPIAFAFSLFQRTVITDRKQNPHPFSSQPISPQPISSATDSTAKQQSFADQYKLPYRIISDADESARKAYKVDKAFMGLVPGESRVWAVFCVGLSFSPARLLCLPERLIGIGIVIVVSILGLSYVVLTNGIYFLLLIPCLSHRPSYVLHRR